MKKDTVYSWIYRQKNKASKEKTVTIRHARLAALKQCEDWLFALTWATMRKPVQEKRAAISTEGFPLIEKENKDAASLTEQETERLHELRASDEIYTQFLAKITPTAFQAELELKERQREQAQRVASRQERRE